MIEHLASLKQKALSGDIEESIEGIDQLLKLENEITNALLKSLEKSTDRFITTERISQAFINHLSKLKKYLENADADISFWAATLIIHYEVNNSIAENILLNTVRHGELSNASVATTILCRVKNLKIKDAIVERLKHPALDDKTERFFKEKLAGIKEWN